eukprot:220551-Hanusia_phi.AAC.3
MILRGGSGDATGATLSDFRAYRSAVKGEDFFLLTSNDEQQWYGCPYCQFINEQTSVLKQHMTKHCGQLADNCSLPSDTAWNLRAVLSANQDGVLEYLIEERAAGENPFVSHWIPFSGKQQQARMRRQRDHLEEVEGRQEASSAEKLRRIHEGPSEDAIALLVKVYNATSRQLFCLKLQKKMEATIKEVKEEVQRTVGIPSDRQRAVSRGNFLRDGNPLKQLAIGKEGRASLYIVPLLVEDADNDERRAGEEARNQSGSVREAATESMAGSGVGSERRAGFIRRLRSFFTGQNNSTLNDIPENETAVVELGGRRLNVTFSSIPLAGLSQFQHVFQLTLPLSDLMPRQDVQREQDVGGAGSSCQDVLTKEEERHADNFEGT